MTTDPIAAARALIEPLTGYTPGPWVCLDGMAASTVCPADNYDSFMRGALVPGSLRIVHDGDPRDHQCVINARLIAAAPDLRDMVATLADAHETERARAENAEAELDQALARLAAMQAELVEWCANIADDNTPAKHGAAPLVAHVTGKTIANTIRCIPLDSDAEAALQRVVANALEAERAKVAAAYEAAAELVALDHVCDAIRALAASDAQAALDKLLEEARLQGWRAGRDAAANIAATSGDVKSASLNDGCGTLICQPVWGDAVAAHIRALPEPKETSHD